jgi:hypothetical protein
VASKKYKFDPEKLKSDIKAGFKSSQTDYSKKPTGNSKTNSNKTTSEKRVIGNDALSRNNPAFAYLQNEGGGKKIIKGSDAVSLGKVSNERKPGQINALGAVDYGASKSTRFDKVMNAAISSTASAYKKAAADITSSTGSLSMGESARAAIDEVKTAKKEGRQAKLGQAQRKAEQDKVKSFNDGWAGDFKQKLLSGAQKSAESASASERHAKEGLGKFGQGVVDFGIAGAQFAGDALLNAIAPGAGLTAMAGRAYGSASLEAQQRGLSEGEQQISGLKSAAIEMLTEKLFGSVSKVAYGKGIIKNESLVNSLVNRLAKTDKGRTALKVLVGANEEGMEEVLSDILNPIADRILKLDDGKGDWSDLADDFDTQQMLEDYIIGGALGLVGAGTNVVSGQYRAENAQQRAYEEYQRQLVNAGLATEQGGDAQLTAEKYKNILDQSTQRGKRNLSDKETENLESLIRGTYAQEDASDVSSRLAQLGTDASEQTVNAIVKAVNGETLNRAEQKAFDANPYSQRVVNEMLDTDGVTSNEWYADRAQGQSITPERGNGISVERAQNVLDTSTANNPQFVNSTARQYEVAPEVVERTYNLNPTAPQAFETAFDAVYQMGQQGTDKAALSKVPVLNTAQANIAYQMGADSVKNVSTDTAAATQTATSIQAAAPVNINNTQEVNNNGVRIRDGGERINGQNTEGQIRGVEAGTGENQVGTAQAQPGGSQSAQIKTGEKVSYKGKQQKGVYYAAEDTEDMKKGRKLAESYGYKVRYFVGGNIRYAGGEFRGVVDTANKTVMVRADHPDYTADQIMRHEMGHAAFENGDLSIDEAKELLLEDFTEKELNDMALKYAEAFTMDDGELVMSIDEAFEEICCDALGRMNIFKGTDLNSESYGKAQDTVRKYAAEKNSSKGRAPPKKGGVKYSKEQTKYDYSKPFAEQIDDWIAGKIPKRDTLIVSGTPKVFADIGMPSLPVTINSSHVDYALNGTKDFDHELGKDLLKQLPEAIKNPVAIMTSKTKSSNSIVAMLEIRHNAKQVVVPVGVTGFGYQNGIRIDSNAITSAYGKNYSIAKVLREAIQEESDGQFSLYYLNEKKATALLQGAKVPMPKMPATRNGGFIHSLTEADSPVKLKIKDVTESQQFKRWFGNSKVINSDGTPKIVYHQTENEFTVFETRREGAGTRDNGTPFGIFLKSSNKDIGLRGKKQMALYAKIENPLRAKNRSEFLKAMQSMSPEYAEIINQHEALDREYKEKTQSAMKEFKNYIIEWRANNPEADSRVLYDDAKFNELFEAEDTLASEWTSKADKLSTKAKEVMTKALEKNGYDGVILERDDGSFGRSTDAYIALHPEQVKSATKNIGTFDNSNPDIRYSREPEKLNELRRQNERKLAQATAEDAANENERGLIRDYQKQYSKVEDILEKLSTAQQTLAETEDGGADYDTTIKAKNRFTVLSNQYAREHRKLENYANMKALQNVLARVDERLDNDLPEGMGAASANFTGEETVGERWVTEAQGKGDSALHPISKEQEANLAEQQQRAPQEIPKKDLNGKLTSKHVSTIANSGMTPAEFSDALREDAAQGKFSHIAYSDEAALKKAERAISVDGWDQALANYKAEVNSGRVSKDNTVMGIALYNNAVNSGDYATAMDIASLMVKNSTNTAQSLQAMRILNKLSPECRLYLAAKSIENIEEDLNERYKDNKADIHVDKILYDEYAKALRQGDEDGIKTAWANIEQSVAQQIDATWYEKLNNFRYLAMLGNPRTHVRNIVGNAFFVPVRAVKNTIAYSLENIADAKINGGIERSKAILNPSNAADAALVKYAMSDFEAVQEVILSGGKFVDTFQGIDKNRTIYKTKILEAARKGNSAALDAEDAWFCKPAYANALAKWYKANGISAEQLNTGRVPEETIIKAQTTAIKEAQRATYRDTNWFSAQVSRLGKVDNKIASVLIEGVLPFKKTPANILARAVEYSPVGLIKSLALDTKKVKAYVNGDVENGMSPAQFIDDVSAGLTGTALMGLGVLLASWGVLSGGEGDDDKQNYFDELSGKQNYALSIGGLSVTLDWLAPESMPLFVGVELFNSLSSKNEDNGFLQNLMSSVMSLSTPMFEMSMLQSVNDLFDNLAYIKQGQGTFKIVSSMAANYISQYFPTLFGQGERAFEETQRETTYVDRNSKVGTELQYMWGKIANKIPFYDFSQIPYIDAWGRTEETGNLFERMLNNFVNPAYVKKERPTEIDGELERLYDLGETSVYPSRAKTNTKINGEYLTADEYVKYATTKGQTSYELAQGVINSAAYSGASDPEKAYMLKYVYSYADHIAKYEVNNDYSLSKWEMAAYKSGNPMQAIIDHAREYYNPDKEN